MWDKYEKSFAGFIDKVLDFTKELGINAEKYKTDHAGLRMKADEDVLKLHDELIPLSKKISESEIHGRKIYIFKLNSPLVYKNFTVPCVELPHPKEGHDYPKDGWEHVEFVIPNADPNSLHNDFRALFPHLTEEDFIKYRYKVTTPKTEGEKYLNTTVTLTKHRGLSVKFHCYPIEKIVTEK